MEKYTSVYIGRGCVNGCKFENDWEFDITLYGVFGNCMCGLPASNRSIYRIYESKEKRLEIKRRRAHNEKISKKISRLWKRYK